MPNIKIEIDRDILLEFLRKYEGFEKANELNDLPRKKKKALKKKISDMIMKITFEEAEKIINGIKDVE